MASSVDVEYSELDSKEGREWNRLCSAEIYDEGYIRLGKTKGVFARSYLTFYDRIKSFNIRDDDVWIVSFPKTGTTWAQEMVWCIMNDLDFEAAKSDLGKRSPYFEVRANWSPRLASIIQAGVVENDTVAPEKKNFFQDSFSLAETMQSPRCIKSHLHFSLLPTQLIERSTKAKMIYVARNPKDTCISFFHHSCLLDGYAGTLEQFVEQFITDNVFCAPFWTHLKEFYDIKAKRDDILFLTYEDMKKDLRSVIRQTSKFLKGGKGKEITSEQVEKLAEHLSFENMKVNTFVNHETVIENLRKIHGRTHGGQFMRKGKVGSWKEELSPEMLNKMDAWIEANKIEGLY